MGITGAIINVPHIWKLLPRKHKWFLDKKTDIIRNKTLKSSDKIQKNISSEYWHIPMKCETMYSKNKLTIFSYLP
jgi:hypothetical protein